MISFFNFIYLIAIKIKHLIIYLLAIYIFSSMTQTWINCPCWFLTCSIKVFIFYWFLRTHYMSRIIALCYYIHIFCKYFPRFACSFFCLFILFVCFCSLGLHLQHMEVPGLGNTAAGLHHSHSNSRSKLYLQPIPQFMAMLDP